METPAQGPSNGQLHLGSTDLETILFNYQKDLEEFAGNINIYDSLSALLVDSKIDELSHLRFQEIENSLRKLPKPPSFQLRTHIFNSIQKTNEEFKAKIQEAQQQYQSALITLKVKLTEAFLNMVNGIVDGEADEKTAEILHGEAIKLVLVRMGALDQKHQKLVQKMFGHDTAEFLSGMTLVEEALMTYRKEMTRHFQLYRCMPCELFCKLHIQAEMTAKTKFNSNSAHLFVEFVNGLNQMHEIFSEMNELIVKSENNLVLDMNQREPKIVNIYKKMMKNEKLEDYEIPKLQLTIKENIKLVEGVKKLSADKLRAASAKVLYIQRQIYNSKMEECLKKAGGMMDLLELKKHHDFYSTDARNTVLFELKKIEGLESHFISRRTFSQIG